jgi:hypothetical protein
MYRSLSQGFSRESPRLRGFDNSPNLWLARRSRPLYFVAPRVVQHVRLALRKQDHLTGPDLRHLTVHQNASAPGHDVDHLFALGMAMRGPNSVARRDSDHA